MASLYQIRAPEPSLGGVMQKIRTHTRHETTELLELVGGMVVEYLRSLTNEIRPPARKGEGSRRAHPGHWADDTGELVRSYYYKVEERARGAVLIIGNTSSHAIWVELRDGFFVVNGVMDNDGPVVEAIRAIAPVAAPGWRVTL